MLLPTLGQSLESLDIQFVPKYALTSEEMQSDIPTKLTIFVKLLVLVTKNRHSKTSQVTKENFGWGVH